MKKQQKDKANKTEQQQRQQQVKNKHINLVLVPESKCFY